MRLRWWDRPTALARCAFCDGRIEPGDAVADVSLGRTVAFDAARRRVWNVCARCGQWNLVALDLAELDAVIAELELRYFATSKRSERDGVGVGEERDGVSLVRLADATWKQSAAWRFGRRLRARRRWWLAYVAGLAVFAFYQPGWLRAFVSQGWATPAILAFLLLSVWWTNRGVVGSARAGDRRIEVPRGRLRDARLNATGDGWSLTVQHASGTSTLTGEPALQLLRQLLFRINFPGAGQRELERALAMVELGGGAAALIGNWIRANPDADWRLGRLPMEVALAFEIAAHEETERRAMEAALLPLARAAAEAESRALIVEAL